MWKGLTRLFQLIPFRKPKVINSQSDSAKALFELGKEKEAFASIKKQLSLDPKDKDLHKILIEKLHEKNRLEELESFCKEVIEMIDDPKSVSIFYFTSGEALFDKKMFPQSLLAFRKARKNLPPMGSELCCKYGEVLQHEGLYEEALFQFEQVKKGPSLNEGSLVWALFYEGRARNGAAYMNYCLGRVQQAKEELEYLLANLDRFKTILSKVHYLLVLYHLDVDERVIDHYKQHELKGWFPLSEGDEWIQFYAQELRITREILQRDDIGENMKKFNAKKLEALNVLFTFLRERIKEEEWLQQGW